MASSMDELNDLHKLVSKSLSTRIVQDLEDNIPTDAATLGAAIKFLKDNAVTADPADADDLKDLQAKLAEAARKRKTSPILALVDSDLKAMEA